MLIFKVGRGALIPVTHEIGFEPIKKKIFCALDTADLNRALSLADELKDLIGGIKVGKEFFTANGPDGVRRLQQAGLPIFLDLKFHDIPNTVAGAVRAAAQLRPFMMNVHASGGEAMMLAAAKALADVSEEINLRPRPRLVAVTVLTSLSQKDIDMTDDSKKTVTDRACELAILAKKCGLDGVVCSGEEVKIIRHACGKDFLLVVPGLRPPWPRHDQKRVVDPKTAYEDGADILIIGRPITDAKDDYGRTISPRVAAEEILKHIVSKNTPEQLMRA